MSILSNIRMILSLSCNESSRLLSDGLDRQLSLTERIALRGHLFACRRCRRFRNILQHLRATTQHLTTPTVADENVLPPLSPEARARLTEALTRAQSEGS